MGKGELTPNTSNGRDLYHINYDAKGNYIGYIKDPNKNGSTEQMEVTYKDGKADFTLYKSMSKNGHYVFYQNSKFQFYRENGVITRFEVSHDREKEPKFGKVAYSGDMVFDAQGNLTKIKEGMQTFTYKYDSNGNVVELIISSDTTPTHYTYKWEKASGNASLYFFDVTKRNRNYFIHPTLY